MKNVLTAAAFAAMLVAPAAAHPHKSDAPDTKTPNTNAEKTTQTFQWKGDDMKEAARDLEDALADTEVFSEMAELFATFASRVDVRKDADSGKTLSFDGEDLFALSRDRSRDSNDRISISGMGRNMTVERETVVEDGRSRTRIVIEMDGGDDVEIDLPKSRRDLDQE